MLTKPKILVVDDNRSNLIALRKLLHKMSCEVVQGNSGNEALALCVTHDFALILLDIEMPGMDGYEVAELLKGEVLTQHIPIIFLTASYADNAHRLRGYEVGAVDYIQKPVDDFILLSKVAVFFELHRSREQAKLELARSEAMRNATREREAMFRQALIDAPNPIMLHAEDGEVILISRVWSELSGYTQQDIPTITAWLLKAYGAERLGYWQAHIKTLFDKPDWFSEGESEIRAADGRTLTWEFRFGPLAPLPDGRRLLIGMAVDATERKLTAQALANEALKNTLLFRTASDGIAILDLSGNVVQANEAFCRLLGYTQEEIQSLNAVRWDVQWGASELEQRIRDLPANGAIFETMYLDSKGHLIDVEINAVRVEINGKPMLYASARDISKRKQIEETLRANEYLLSNALRISHLGTWEWNLFDHSEIWSDQQFRIFGLDPTQHQASSELFFNAIHADDRAKVNQAVERALAAVCDYEVECRIVWPSGEIRYIHCQGEVYRNDADQPFLMIGTVLDITEQHHREEAQRLATTVFNTVDEGVMVTGPDERIIAVNPAFTKITGYDPADVIGQTPTMLTTGLAQEEIFSTMLSSLNSDGWWVGEMSYRRKNDEVFVLWLSIKVVRDQKGVITHRVGVFSDITEKKKAEKLIWRQANFDALTQLANRHMLQDRLQQEVKRAKREKLPLALLVIDLDHFKEINDTLGHDMGDVLLVQASQRIMACVRASDTVARLGGDEFVIILAALDDTDCVDRIAKKLVASLVTPFTLNSEEAFISASIGVAIYPNDATEIDDLLKHADQAMYVSKNAGRNRFSYFASAMQEAAQARRRLTNDLRGALENQQFRVYFQPIVEMATGSIYKAEALIRWQHPVRGLVSPAEFIPLAEESGLIVDIGDWVFKESAREVKRLRALHHPDFQISVNKSPMQFRSDGGSDRSWFQFLSEMNLSGQGIVIEITEGLLMNVEDNVTEKLLAFRDAGIQVSLDDFGTGYSSLSYLKKFNIDYLKIDQSFVSNMDTDADNLTLCELIIVMAHKLGLRVIAEGVETIAQRDLLAAAGCDFAQGYLYSRPIPAEEFEILLAKTRVAPLPHDL